MESEIKFGESMSNEEIVEWVAEHQRLTDKMAFEIMNRIVEDVRHEP